MAAGMLDDIFQAEMTLAISTCAGCGACHPVGELQAFLSAPGLVLRCCSCGITQIRLVQAPGRSWLDLGGVRSLELRPRSGDAPA